MVVVEGKVEFDPHLAGADAAQALVGFAFPLVFTRFAPERIGDPVE